MAKGTVHLHGMLIVCLLALGLPACFSSWSYCLAACSIAVGVFVFLPRYKWFACASFVGFSISLVQLYLRIDSQLPVELEGRPLLADIEVVGLPQERGAISDANYFIRFDARINSVQGAEGGVDGLAFYEGGHSHDKLMDSMRGRKLRLSWRRSSAGDDGIRHIKPGQRWLVEVRLRRPRGTVNPRGFDYQAWLLQKNISATGYVNDRKRSRMLPAGSNVDGASHGVSVIRFVDSLRYGLAKQIERALALSHGDGQRLGLLQALTIGEKSNINADQWELLNATGTTHLMAISGLHIGLVAFCAFFVGRFLVRALWFLRSPFIIRLLPALFSLFAAGFYAMLAGFAIPTQRALMLVALLQLAYVSGRKVDPLSTLLLVAVVICIGDPFAFLQKGFWLSFAAVVSLMWFGVYRVGRLSWWKATLLSQIVVFVGLCFPLAILGLPVSFVSPLANLIAVPIVSFVCIPPLLLGALFGSASVEWAGSLFRLSDAVLEYILAFLAALSAVADSWGVGVTNISVPWFVGYICVFASLMMFLPGHIRLQPFFLLVLMGSLFAGWPAKEAYLTVMDVGQGLSVYAQMPVESIRRKLPVSEDLAIGALDAKQLGSPVEEPALEGGVAGFIYDMGARHSADFDIGSRTVAPYILTGGVKRVDLAVISHADNDHAGGLSGLAKRVAIDSLVTGRQEGVLAKEIAQLGEADVGSIEECRAGMAWSAYGSKATMTVDVLWPTDQAIVDAGMSRNNLSCVVLLEVQGARILLAGDIEHEVEQRLVALYADVLSGVDVLLVPHHGSKTSSSEAFVQLVKPRYVVVSAGYRNRYRHPSTTVLERYRRAGAKVYNTATDGAITFRVSRLGAIEVLAQRKVASTLWYSR